MTRSGLAGLGGARLGKARQGIKFTGGKTNETKTKANAKVRAKASL